MSGQAPTAIDRLVEQCRAGSCPRVVARMDSGWLVMAEQQVFDGYCLLLPDPVARHLNALTGARLCTHLQLGRLPLGLAQQRGRRDALERRHVPGAAEDHIGLLGAVV